MRSVYFLAMATMLAITNTSMAQSIDFNEFEEELFPPTDGFPDGEWDWTANEARIFEAPDNPFIDDAFNASASVFYGPDNVLGKRIVGKVFAGPNDGQRRADDDYLGLVFGIEPGDGEFGSPDAFEADFVLIDWKGVDQSFDFNDGAGADFFTGATLGGFAPAGLALSQVNGLPTADELWQHVDSEDNFDGGVTELARARTLGRTPYDRSVDAEPYIFDVSYTEDRVTVIVNDVLEFDVRGDFADGRFGVYSAWQGPTPTFADFEMFDAVREVPDAFPEVTVNRETGEISLLNSGDTEFSFTSYTITSDAGSLLEGGESATELAAEGGSLAADSETNLGQIWTKSQFEDLLVLFEQEDGLLVPVIPDYVGNGDEAFLRSDLNTDGSLDQNDWLLFFPNSLAEFENVSIVESALLGDLDGDFDSDVDDFSLFKADYDLINGDGSFSQMAAAVPEPNAGFLSAFALICLGALRSGRKKGLTACCVALVLAGLLTAPQSAQAQFLDFTEFTLERFPPTGGFAEAEWDVTETTATILGGANASSNIFYSPENVMGKRIRGFLDPSTDDDQVGLAFGFQPGDASFIEGSDDPADYTADYLLLQWKGVDQNFNFNDPDNPEREFNNLTGGGIDFAGLALSRVNGLVNSDELWQHSALEENSLGGAVELARAFTLGRTPYDRDPNATPVEFDIVFQENQFVVIVDGSLEFFETGTFSDGRFGLYTGWQSAGPEFSDFELLDANTLDLSTLILKAEVDRSTGDITISNNTGEAVDMDFYQFESDGGSLINSWQGLADQESGADAEAGNSWVKAGGADDQSIGELLLFDSTGELSFATLAQGDSVTLEGAYNGAVNAEDLLFRYRFPDGSLNAGLVTYVGEPAVGSPFDCNADGLASFDDLTCSNAAGTTTDLLAELNLLPGDLDGVNGVGFADFLTLSGNFGTSTSSYLDGDIDGSGTVDFADFLTLSANFGASVPAEASSVPEPAANHLVLIAGIASLLARRRR